VELDVLTHRTGGTLIFNPICEQDCVRAHLNHFESQEEKLSAKHGVRKTDVEEALFDGAHPTAILGKENTGDYEGPVYEAVGRTVVGDYLLLVLIHIGDNTGIVLTAYFLEADTKAEINKIIRYSELTGGG